MGFLKKFFRNVFHETAPAITSTSSFECLSEEELETHLAVSKYGDFQLTDAVRPSYDLKVMPEQGYRFDTYVDEETQSAVPVLMVAASREKLFEMFMDMVDQLGDEVDVVLETSHSQTAGDHVDLYREHIDLPVLKSMLWDFEDLLLNDGCTGIAVLNPNIPQEIQLDEHKLLIVYGNPLSAYEKVLAEHGLMHRKGMKFITEAEHVHSSSEQYHGQFDILKNRLGMDCGYENLV